MVKISALEPNPALKLVSKLAPVKNLPPVGPTCSAAIIDVEATLWFLANSATAIHR